MRLGLTFSDVLIVPKRSPLRSRTEADTRTRFTRNVFLNIPLVSSNMATVTEHKMAIAMAREGGLGVIHQFNTVEEQVEEIRKVKRSTSYVIENPLSVPPYITLGEAVKTMKTMMLLMMKRIFILLRLQLLLMKKAILLMREYHLGIREVFLKERQSWFLLLIFLLSKSLVPLLL